MRVLVVDDNPTFLMQMKKILTLKKFCVDVAERGKKAVEMMNKLAYDAVILDLKMPDISGIEVMKEARKRNIKTNFIVVTGYGEVESAVEAMKLGAIDYIQKPFDIAKVINAIENLKGKAQHPFTNFIKSYAEGKIIIISSEKPEKFEQKHDIEADEKIWLHEVRDLEEIVQKVNFAIEDGGIIIHSGIKHIMKRYGKRELAKYLKKLDEIAESKNLRIFIACKNIKETRVLDEIYGKDISIDEIADICKNNVRRKIIGVLKIYEELSYSQIMKKLDIDYSSKIAFHLKKLCNLRLVEKIDKKYVLTPYGKYVAEIIDMLVAKKGRITYFVS